MAREGRKQFSLSLLMRVFLAVMVVTSILVFANSVMRYNTLLEEKERLEEELEEYRQIREELEELKGSPIDRDYIIRIAKQMGLYFPDEEIFYNDANQ